jgi:hypothetical protein
MQSVYWMYCVVVEFGFAWSHIYLLSFVFTVRQIYLQAYAILCGVYIFHQQINIIIMNISWPRPFTSSLSSFSQFFWWHIPGKNKKSTRVKHSLVFPHCELEEPQINAYLYELMHTYFKSTDKFHGHSELNSNFIECFPLDQVVDCLKSINKYLKYRSIKFRVMQISPLFGVLLSQ